MFGTNAGRIVAGAGIALALTMGATACGGGEDGKSIDKAAFTKKLKAEKRFEDAPAKYVDCVRKIALKYGEDDRIQKYIDGKVDYDDANIVKSKSDQKKAQGELTSCIK